MPRYPTSIRIDPEIVKEVRRLQYDPVTRRTRHGSLSDLITKLLLDWIAEQNYKEPSK